MQDQMKYCAVNHGLPCLNPACRSKGRPHPNCMCYGGGGQGDYAKGGAVCAGPHLPECQYYVDGGLVNIDHITPAHAIGHAAISHGLLGLMKNVGHSKLADPENHHKTIEKVKSQISMGEHAGASEELHGSPMGGSAGKNNLREIIGHLGPSIMHNESHPESLRSSIDYLHSSVRGHETLKHHIAGFLEKKTKDDIEPDEKGRAHLKEFLAETQQNPEKLLDVGEKLAHYMPDHAAGLAAMTASAVQYLNSIKPMNSQTGMLDETIPPDKTAVYQWDRQLDIAQKPMMVLQHVKDGTLLPADLTTLTTIFPKLRESMVEKATEMLTDYKAKDKEIPYKQKLTLSMLLGQPIDSTQTPQAMQAIMKAQGPVQAQNQSSGKKPAGKATDVELRQINKVDEMSETPLQARQINRNKH